jgi:hypothetical protein
MTPAAIEAAADVTSARRQRFGVLHAHDRFHAHRVEVERLAAVLRMRAHQRVDARRRQGEAAHLFAVLSVRAGPQSRQPRGARTSFGEDPVIVVNGGQD